MRICFLCNEYPPGPHGGIGTVVQVLGRALAQAGHQVRVVGMYPPGYPAPDYQEDQGVRVWRLREPGYRLGWILARYRLFRIIAKWSLSGAIDLIEVPDWEGWAAGWPRLPVPVVARTSGSQTYFAGELDRPLKRTAFCLERLSLRRADYWCSVSKYTAGVTRRVFDLATGPDAILYNPVEMPVGVQSGLRSKNKVVFSGTLTAKKGIISLVRAWPRVVEGFSTAELHIYGKDGPADGPGAGGQSMQAYLRSLLDDQANQSVYFHGHVARETLFEAFQAARLAVFPSYAEAFGIAPVEAMSYGCPTIYTRRLPGPEVIRNGLDGLLVDPGQPGEIADAILQLLIDDDLAWRLGVAGQERFESHFSVKTVLPQNEAFYHRCIESYDNSRRADYQCKPANNSKRENLQRMSM